LPAETSFLVELGIIAGSALAFSLLAWRLRLPLALGQLVAGMIIGPFGFRLVTDMTTIQILAEIGIVLLLFIVGLELDPFRLRRLGTKIIVFSITEISVSFAAGLAAGLTLGWSIPESLVLAGVLGISSTAVVAKMLQERRAMSETWASIMMGALVIEDIVAVVILSALPQVAAGNAFEFHEIGFWFLKGTLLILVTVLFGVYLAPRIIDRISQLDVDIDEAGFLLALSLGFAMAILSSTLGFSAGTGAFMMGLVIVGKRARFVYEKIHPVRDLFLIVFFVSMGMLVDPSQLLNLAVVVPILVLAILGKYAGSYLGVLLSGQRKEASDVAIRMNPRGEFSFVIAREASSTGVARALIYPIAGTVVIVTTLIASLAQIRRKKTQRIISGQEGVSGTSAD
jgi:CPA2 family monovalent cation:H+ antiporter-2